MSIDDIFAEVAAAGTDGVYVLTKKGLIFYLDRTNWIRVATLPSTPWAEQHWAGLAISPQGFAVAVGNGGFVFKGTSGANDADVRFLRGSLRRYGNLPPAARTPIFPA